MDNKDPFQPKSAEVMSIKLTPATIEDAAKVLELWKSGSSEYAFINPSLDDVVGEIRNHDVVLIEENGALVGSLGYARDGADGIFISSFVITPGARGRGVGRAALQAFLEQSKGYKRIEAQTGENNQGMLALAKELGFVQTGDVHQLENGQKIVYLERVRQDG